jgi:alpha-D-ribose 1-methylphosphonate 5-phosphate C-P lyase
MPDGQPVPRLEDRAAAPRGRPQRAGEAAQHPRRRAGVATTTRTASGTTIQTRHRIPETPLREDQILLYQVPMPEPPFRLDPRLAVTTRLHALADYGLMHVTLQEDIACLGHIGLSLMSPSPIPAFDNPKMHRMPALQVFGAGGEKRIQPCPHTDGHSLDFEDHPFRPIRAAARRALGGSDTSYLDEVVTDDAGGRLFVCSGAEYCGERQARQRRGEAA